MKRLILIIIHPTHIVKNRKVVSWWLITWMTLVYMAFCGLAFQHLYPRLLNEIPWLGFFRKMKAGNINPAFDIELFLRGTGMGLAVYITYALSFALLSIFSDGKRLKWNQSVLAAGATSAPILVTSVIGFFFFHIHPILGLIPLYGFFISSSLKVLLLRDLLKLERGLIGYLAPSLMAGQLSLCYLLMP